MESIIREIFILSSRRVAPIDIVYGSAVPVLFKMMDVTVPAGADVVFYAQQADGPVYMAEGWEAENIAGFIPPEGFFALGGNLLQVEINGKLIPIAVEVRCHERLSGMGSSEAPEQVRPLVQQALDAARDARDRAAAALESQNAAAGSANAAAGAAGAAAGSADAAAGSAQEAGDAAAAAGQAANAAAGSAQAALESQNAAAGSASAAAGAAGAAAGSANAAAGSAQEAGDAADAADQSANAASESAQAALESQNAAAESASAAAGYASSAAGSADAAAGSAQVAGDAADAADQSANAAAGSAQAAEEARKKAEEEAAKRSVKTICGVLPDESGNVALTADNVGARPDSWTPTADDVGAATPEQMNAAVKKAAPRNLLDNSDFTNLVAQAGIGGSHGSVAYAADRWILDSGAASYSDGVGLTLTGTIKQKLERAPTGQTSAFVGIVSGTASISYLDGAVTITSSGGVIKWAALYEGEYTDETMPVYQPKGYGAELLECMRYYREQSDRLCAGFMYNSTTACFVYHINPPMRTTPTIIELAGNLLQHGFVDATLAGISHQKDYLIAFDMLPVSPLNSGEGVIFNGRIKLSTDL